MFDTIQDYIAEHDDLTHMVEVGGKFYHSDDTITCECCGAVVCDHDAFQTDTGEWVCSDECAEQVDEDNAGDRAYYAEVRSQYVFGQTGR